MPTPSPTAGQFSSTDPETLVNEMPLKMAEQIVSEWRAAKEAPGVSKARAQSVVQYKRNFAMLESKYSRENNIEIGNLNPVDLLKQFFKHSLELLPAAWRLYRYSLLFIMNERAIEMAAKGMPQRTLIIALAALIIVKKPPYKEISQKAPRPATNGVRNKSLRTRYFEELITHLAVDYAPINIGVRRAQSFAIATLATGLRPTEWKHAHLHAAEPDEVPGVQSSEGWLCLRIKTAKRKEHEVDWDRTFYIEPGICQIHIIQHYESLMEYVGVALESDPTAENPDKLYIRRASRKLADACKHLWPNKSALWITLASLRSQARANFAAAYGVNTAAAMLGHSPATSQSYYAGSHRAYSKGGEDNRSGAPITVPVPGADVQAKAAVFATREIQAANVATSREAYPTASHSPAADVPS
jgi:hypothetical protein